jgi:tripartite-type tricarboxylate transporter receptor subunit TctC
MSLPRRRFLHLASGAVALPAVSRFAWAQAYPTKAVRVVVGFAAGGATDILARLMGQWLSDRLGQSFIIENRTGAASNIATEAVVRAPSDGYTLLVVTPPNAINATLYERLNYNFIRDITPVSGVFTAPNVLDVNPSVPAKTVPEFIAHAKANPGKLSMSSAGVGSVEHVSGELFKMMTGGPCAVSRCRSGSCRSSQRTGTGHVRRFGHIDRIYQGRQAAPAGGDHCDPLRGAARHPDSGRVRAGL